METKKGTAIWGTIVIILIVIAVTFWYMRYELKTLTITLVSPLKEMMMLIVFVSLIIACVIFAMRAKAEKK